MARWKERDWLDGHYELFMDFDDPYAWIDAAQALWAQSNLSGVWTSREFDPDTDPRFDAGNLSVICELMTGHLHGVAHLPNGSGAPCGCGAIPAGRNWLIFYLPISGLGNYYDLGGFPFGDYGRPWVFEVDQWLVELATTVFGKVPFRVAAIGSELSTLTTIQEFEAGMPEKRLSGLLVPAGDELRWYPPTFTAEAN